MLDSRHFALIPPHAESGHSLVLAELGWMSMAIVDTMMVGRLPTGDRHGRVSLGSNIFIVLALFGGGLLMGLGYARRRPSERASVRTAIVPCSTALLSIALTPFLPRPSGCFPLFSRDAR